MKGKHGGAATKAAPDGFVATKDKAGRVWFRPTGKPESPDQKLIGLGRVLSAQYEDAKNKWKSSSPYRAAYSRECKRLEPKYPSKLPGEISRMVDKTPLGRRYIKASDATRNAMKIYGNTVKKIFKIKPKTRDGVAVWTMAALCNEDDLIHIESAAFGRLFLQTGKFEAAGIAMPQSIKTVLQKTARWAL